MNISDSELQWAMAALSIAVALIVTPISFIFYFCKKKRHSIGDSKITKKIKELEGSLMAALQKCAGERKGRIRAQQDLREALSKKPKKGGIDLTSYPMAPIGVVKSCYSTRNGTPRQPLLVPLARASLVFDTSRVPEAALEGLEGYSHCWIVYVFHLNTDLDKLWKHPSQSKFKAKVRVPRLKGERLGVFATRTPHRPCPIGLTVAKKVETSFKSNERWPESSKQGTSHTSPHHSLGDPIEAYRNLCYRSHSPNDGHPEAARVFPLPHLTKVEEVRGHTVLLSGVDLVDGTPVLDIKPYLPYCDSIQRATVPDWVKMDNVLAITSVNFSGGFSSSLAECWSAQEKKSLYASPDEFQSLIRQVLSWDIRSVSQRRVDDSSKEENSVEDEMLENRDEVPSCTSSHVVYHLILEDLNVSYRIDSEANVLVESVSPASNLQNGP